MAFNLPTNAVLACCRLFSLLRVCAVTVMPEGTCVNLAQLACLFLCCPPAPLPLYQLSDRSSSRSSKSHTASGSVTLTVTVLVCTLPRFSVGGILCQRCPPASLSRQVKSLPAINNEMAKLPCPVVLGLTSSQRQVQPKRPNSFV